MLAAKCPTPVEHIVEQTKKAIARKKSIGLSPGCLQKSVHKLVQRQFGLRLEIRKRILLLVVER